MTLQPKYKFEIIELTEPGRLRLVVYINDSLAEEPAWCLTDIIEGPTVFIINRLTSYYDETRRLRKVK